MQFRVNSVSLNWVDQCDVFGGRRGVASYNVAEFRGIVVLGLDEPAPTEQFSNGPRGHFEDVRDCILRR